MKIKLIAENEDERELLKDFRHEKVKEVFIFGNKEGSDGVLEDFHFWRGEFRYLLGSIAYFENELKEKRSNGERSKSKSIPFDMGETESMTDV